MTTQILHSILFSGHEDRLVTPVDCRIFDTFKTQTDVQFGFIPLSDPILPESDMVNTMVYDSIAEILHKVDEFGSPNFLGARIPIKTQLTVDKWKQLLQGYWDTQLLWFIKFGLVLIENVLYKFIKKMDLSWPKGYSVNDGVENNMYMG